MKKILLTFYTLLFATFITQAQTIYGLTATNQLFSFQASTPAIATTPTTVTGFASGFTLVGMDFRPATGELFALAYNSTMQSAKMYTISLTSAMATEVGTGINNLVLNGKIAFDFNPTVERIRLETSNGENYRLNPNNGTLAATDGNISYATSDVNAGKPARVGSAAYTNSYIASTSTGLYVYDDSLNVLAFQKPPNNGVLNTIGMSGISVPANGTSDMDIVYNENTGVNVIYFTTQNLLGASALYTININTGAATLVGPIGLGLNVKKMSAQIVRSNPAVTGPMAYALSVNNNLVSFDLNNPEYIYSSNVITGLQNGFALLSIDFRPLDKKIYGLAYRSTDMTAKIYRIDKMTAMATLVTGDSISNKDLSGRISIDFNPTVDRIRVVTSNGKNYRLNQITGTLAANDGDLAFASGDVNVGIRPNISAAAYTNSFNGATTTTLFVYDDSLNILCTQIPPNDGVLNTIGSSGIMFNNAMKSVDMDVYYNPATMTNTAYLIGNRMGSFDSLYQVNTSNGMLMPISKVGLGINVSDIAIMPSLQTSTRNLSGNNVENLRVYPNPVQNQLFIDISSLNNQQGTIRILDVRGAVLNNIQLNSSSESSNIYELNVSNLSKGLYIIELSNGDSKSISKIIK